MDGEQRLKMAVMQHFECQLILNLITEEEEEGNPEDIADEKWVCRSCSSAQYQSVPNDHKVTLMRPGNPSAFGQGGGQTADMARRLYHSTDVCC